LSGQQRVKQPGAARLGFAVLIGTVEGIRAGAALAVCVAVLAFLGLNPSLAWIPEVPLLGAAVLVPLTVLGLAGYRAGKRSGYIIAGALASGMAGAIGGGVGGLAYVLFGKPVLNVAVGLLLGAVGGAIVGAVGASVSRHTSQT
jgi:hypothetical protein